MKKIILSLLFISTFISGTVLAATPSVTSIKKQQTIKLEKQLASFVISSGVAKGVGQEGSALVHFQVNANNRLTNVTVDSDNPSLDAHLAKELNGKKLVGVHPSYRSTYVAMVRL